MTLTIERRPALRSVALLLAALVLIAGTPVAGAVGRLVSVVVMSTSAPAAADATQTFGGTVQAPLPIVDGVLARVPSSRIAELSRHAIVVADRAVTMQSAEFGGSLTTAYPHEVGATSLWSDGATGSGTTVALIDTGIADVPDVAGRVIASADLSPELTFDDGYGHGTFMAGLIAGNGASSGGSYVGVAPEAKLMSVKVAGADGSTSLGRVLMGASLVDAYAERFNVRVALLAIDSRSPLPPSLDPLSLALRRLWADGIVVVVPSGNHGPDGDIASPGEDPVLLTAGSVDDLKTNDVFDDVVSDFASRGPTRWGFPKPDVAAPGHHLVSLRAPGSTIDAANPSARVEDAYFKGSGTSMSAAVTAGSAALILSERPELSPDQVKAMLMGSATPIPNGDASSVGAGVVNAAAAVAAGAPELPAISDDNKGDRPEFPAFQGRHFDWFGSEAAGYRWLAREWNAREWAAREWNAREWAAREWAAREWAAARWEAREWNAREWNAREWNDDEWNAREWNAREWANRYWAAREWAAREWNAREWNAREWASDEWLARQWVAREWSAREWNAREWSAREWNAREWSAREWSAREWNAREWSAREWNAREWSAREWSAREWNAREWNAREWSAREWSAREWSARAWSSHSWV